MTSSVGVVGAGQRFVVRGRVANAGRQAGPALLTLTLRASGHPIRVYALHGAALRSVPAHRSRAFSVHVVAPKVASASGHSFVLQVCVKTKRRSPSSCRKAKRRVVVAPARSTPTPSPTPMPSPTPTPSPTPVPAAPEPLPLSGDTPVYTPGASTLNDSLFPTIGNGGYDATHYDLDLDYAVSSKQLDGTTSITARATQNLSQFSFDLTGSNRVSSVTVDGVDAAFRQDDPDSKLFVTPSFPIAAGASFVVTVTYGGVAQPYIDPDGASDGFIPSPAHGAIVVSEPVGAMSWYPNNNVPYDRATYTIRMTVPSAYSVVANGVLEDKRAGPSTTAYTWDNDAPTSSYLVGLGIGKYDLSFPDPAQPTLTVPGLGSLNAPVPFYTAVDSSFTTGKPAILDALNHTPEMLDFFADYYGLPYPYSSTGGIVPRQDVGYSLEVLGRPIYAISEDEAFTGPDLTTVAHELAHQYFGDLVTLHDQKDMWLNEGPAGFNEWLWNEQDVAHGGDGVSVQAHYDDLWNRTDAGLWSADCYDGIWSCPTASPATAADIFGASVYSRGAMTIFGIDRILGEPAFRQVMHDYLAAFSYGDVRTADFIAFVKAHDPVPGRGARWDEFFKQWLYTAYAQPAKPTMTYENFGTYPLV